MSNMYSYMDTQRFNLGYAREHPNAMFFGLFDLIRVIYEKKVEESKPHWPPPKIKMLEIGSHMGESIMMFASSNIFSEVHCIEPFEGYEKFNDVNNYDWNFIQEQFKINTRFFDNIILHNDFSYNVVSNFEDETFDFIYIDANHEYEHIKRDIELYLPKLKKDGIFGGHDYYEEKWPGVVNAVNEVFGKPKHTFFDTSWLTYDI